MEKKRITDQILVAPFFENLCRCLYELLVEKPPVAGMSLQDFRDKIAEFDNVAKSEVASRRNVFGAGFHQAVRLLARDTQAMGQLEYPLLWQGDHLVSGRGTSGSKSARVDNNGAKFNLDELMFSLVKGALLWAEHWADGHKITHLCSYPQCVAPNHLTAESGAIATMRNACHRDHGLVCPHLPKCVRGGVELVAPAPTPADEAGDLAEPEAVVDESPAMVKLQKSLKRAKKGVKASEKAAKQLREEKN